MHQQSVHLTGGMRTLRKAESAASAYFGTIVIIHARPPASNARR